MTDRRKKPPSIAHALIGAVFKPIAESVNISHLARAVGVSPQRLHGYWTGRFPWPADVALRVLSASGKVKLWREGFAVHVVIPASVIKDLGPLVGSEVVKLKEAAKRRQQK